MPVPSCDTMYTVAVLTTSVPFKKVTEGVYCCPCVPKAGCSRRGTVVAASSTEPGSKNKQSAATTSSRNARLYELSDDDGWGVEAVPAASQPVPQPQPAAAAPATKQKQKQQQESSKGTREVVCCAEIISMPVRLPMAGVLLAQPLDVLTSDLRRWRPPHCPSGAWGALPTSSLSAVVLLGGHTICKTQQRCCSCCHWLLAGVRLTAATCVAHPCLPCRQGPPQGWHPLC